MAILACAGIAGCGGAEGDDAEDAPPATGGAREGDETVEIVDFLYEPEDLTVAAGTTLTWVNGDKAPHTATAEDGSFDTGRLEQGDEGEVTLTDSGTYAYVCGFHAFMKATVVVE